MPCENGFFCSEHRYLFTFTNFIPAPNTFILGNGIGNLQYCATNSCPNVAGKEYEFIKNLAIQNGFEGAIDKSKTTCQFDVVGVSSSTCVAEGANGTLYMVLRLEQLDTESLRTTYACSPDLPKLPDMPNASPKVWLDLEVNLTRTWGN